MRRALSLVAAAVVMLASITASRTSSAADAGTDGSAGTDSGIGTTPSPNNPTIPLDSGTDAGASSSSSGDDSGGCSVVSPSSSSEGWSTALGLFTAASILVLSRRRRGKR